MPAAKTIEVLPVKVSTFKVRIESTAPMLRNKMAEESVKAIRAKSEGTPKEKAEAIDPDTEWLKSLHVMPSYGKKAGQKGCRYGMPAQAIHDSMIAACSFLEGITKVQARGSIQVIPQEGCLVEIKGTPVCDIQTFPNKRGVAVTSHRARFDAWSATLTISYAVRVITPDMIVNLLNSAGFYIGLGSRRRQTGNSNGTFRVVGSD